jgi:acyl-CoA thioesterase-1
MAFKRFLARLAILVAVVMGSAATSAQAEPFRIVGFGDSLMAGYGLDAGQGFTDQLQAALQAAGYDATVANAGVSGDTSSSALARLDWSIPDGTQLVILEIGANDMLRGIDPAIVEKNIAAMLERLKQRRIPVLLAGMLAAPNLGPDYAQRFNGLYPLLSQRYGVPLYPFFLDKVAADASVLQPDGMHPTAAGIARIVEAILPTVEAQVDRLRGE